MKKWKNSAGLRQNLQARMPEIVTAWFLRGRAAMAEGVSWQQMHEFRLRTKRFRYTLELFRPAYGPGLERKLKALKKLQDYLGDINDAIITENLISSLPESNEAQEELRAAAAKLTKKLRSYWSEALDAPGEEQRWIRYLRQYAARRPAPGAHLRPPASTTNREFLADPAAEALEPHPASSNPD
jgi:CHAD domain-containing protein